MKRTKILLYILTLGFITPIGIIVGIADEGLGERAVEQQEEGIDLWTVFCSGLETRRPAGSIRQRATTN